MKAEQLRIGNIIYDNFYQKPIVVNWEIIRDSWCFPHAYKPIKLNEEWLLNLGLKKFYTDWTFKDVIIHTRKDGLFLKRRCGKIEYVHQLQNLIFALKQKELTAKVL